MNHGSVAVKEVEVEVESLKPVTQVNRQDSSI